MTSNPLGQYCYAVNAVLTDIGWLTSEEKASVESLLDDGIVHFTSDLQQLHVYWPVLADSMDNAVSTAGSTLRSAIEATGVPCPHIRSLHVDEIGHQ